MTLQTDKAIQIGIQLEYRELAKSVSDACARIAELQEICKHPSATCVEVVYRSFSCPDCGKWWTAE